MKAPTIAGVIRSRLEEIEKKMYEGMPQQQIVDELKADGLTTLTLISFRTMLLRARRRHAKLIERTTGVQLIPTVKSKGKGKGKGDGEQDSDKSGESNKPGSKEESQGSPVANEASRTGFQIPPRIGVITIENTLDIETKKKQDLFGGNTSS